MQVLGLIAAVLMICAVVSTPETRAAGRVAVARFTKPATIATAAIWAAILLL